MTTHSQPIIEVRGLTRRFGDHVAVVPVCRHLGSDDGREHGFRIFDHRGGGFIAGGFDAEDAH